MLDQYWERLKGRIWRLIGKFARDNRCYNRDIVADGVVKSVSTDGKRADVYLNGVNLADPPGEATPGIPNPLGLSLAVGDQVKVLMADPRDPAILYKKII